MSSKRICLFVRGMHCASCKILIEDALMQLEGVSQVFVDVAGGKVEIETKHEGDLAVFLKTCNQCIPSGYSLSDEMFDDSGKWNDLLIAVPVGGLFLLIFFLLQKSGIIDFGITGDLTPWTAGLIGVIASLSTCLALVGGFVLSLSAKVSQEVSSFRPHALFHTGRILGFAFLGAVLGAFGTIFALNQVIVAILGIMVAVVMVMLGIHLLGIFRRFRLWQISIPRTWYDRMGQIQSGFWAPFLVGVFTFFLPCGFTQSMQFMALSSGSWIEGATIMSMFALGTLPVLVLITFSSYTFARSRWAQIFSQSAGIIVIGFGFLALINGLASLGILPPLLTF